LEGGTSEIGVLALKDGVIGRLRRVREVRLEYRKIARDPDGMILTSHFTNT